MNILVTILLQLFLIGLIGNKPKNLNKVEYAILMWVVVLVTIYPLYLFSGYLVSYDWAHFPQTDAGLRNLLLPVIPILILWVYWVFTRTSLSSKENEAKINLCVLYLFAVTVVLCRIAFF